MEPSFLHFNLAAQRPLFYWRRYGGSFWLRSARLRRAEHPRAFGAESLRSGWVFPSTTSPIPQFFGGPCSSTPGADQASFRFSFFGTALHAVSLVLFVPQSFILCNVQACFSCFRPGSTVLRLRPRPWRLRSGAVDGEVPRISPALRPLSPGYAVGGREDHPGVVPSPGRLPAVGQGNY